MQDDPKRYWMAFNLVKGIGSARMRLLLDHFGAAQAAWEASPAELEAAGLSAKLAEAVAQVRSSGQVDQVWDSIQEQGITLLTWEDEAYPRRLKEIDQPPPVLYLRGRLADEDQWSVAIVGTRRATPYGRQAAEELAAGLARRGISVVSGLARGIDAIAHQAALKAEGRSLAVLGSGVDNIYPPEHHRLAEQLCAAGGLVSDYPPGTPPDAANFPPRNRIISGLSLAVVVIEAGESSGALITAAFASEQGRAVFALPGSIYAPQSKGTNRLIRQGAQIYLDIPDLLEVLNLGQVSQQRAARQALPADATEAKLYAILGHEPVHVDEIGARSDLPIAQVAATLALMELKGMVRQVGGMNYVAVFEEKGDYQIEND
jgi:DNA processing protein